MQWPLILTTIRAETIRSVHDTRYNAHDTIRSAIHLPFLPGKQRLVILACDQKHCTPPTMCQLPNSKQKPMVIVVSQLPGLISGINFPVTLDSPSQLMFLKGLWRRIFSKTHLTYSFILVMSYVYLYSSSIFTSWLCMLLVFHLHFTLSIHFSFICIYIVILQTISLFCIVLH